MTKISEVVQQFNELSLRMLNQLKQLKDLVHATKNPRFTNEDLDHLDIQVNSFLRNFSEKILQLEKNIQRMDEEIAASVENVKIEEIEGHHRTLGTKIN